MKKSKPELSKKDIGDILVVGTAVNTVRNVLSSESLEEKITKEIMKQVNNRYFGNMLDEQVPREMIIEEAVSTAIRKTSSEIFRRIEQLLINADADCRYGYSFGDFKENELKSLKKEFLK